MFHEELEAKLNSYLEHKLMLLKVSKPIQCLLPPKMKRGKFVFFFPSDVLKLLSVVLSILIFFLGMKDGV